MTPSGVEQFHDGDTGTVFVKVNQTMTPSGVKQMVEQGRTPRGPHVNQTMTPSGVEQVSAAFPSAAAYG